MAARPSCCASFPEGDLLRSPEKVTVRESAKPVRHTLNLVNLPAARRAPKGCPCTPQLLCSTDQRGIFNEFCDIPRAPVATYSMHGGAGGIMSIGLLRAVSLNYMDMCIKSLYSTGWALLAAAAAAAAAAAGTPGQCGWV